MASGLTIQESKTSDFRMGGNDVLTRLLYLCLI